MSDLLDKSRIEIKLGSYATAPASALGDAALLARVQAYRRQTGARMVALDRETAKKKMPSGDYHVSRKIDGEFCVLVWDGKEAVTVNPGGTVRLGLPLHEEAARLMKGAKLRSGLFAGELYAVTGNNGARPRVHDVSRVARRPESAKALQTLRLAIFDVLEADGAAPGARFAEEWKRIEKVFGGGELVHAVETEVAKNAGEALAIFEKWVDGEGAEGIVARSDTSGIFKIKPRHTLDVVVIGFAEGTEDRAGMLHDMLLAMMRADGTFQVLGRVGGGFSDGQRRDFLSDLQDMAAESDYAEVNSDRVAYQMVRPEWVVEISCLDLVAQTTRGASIDRMTLEWAGDRWGNIRRLPLVSIISPQFLRRREDKEARPGDVRFSQLTDIVEIAQADKTAEDLAMPKSEVLRREAVTKTLKGATMVRKLVMWKTNKDGISEDYPAYVVHLTDFSPNRKDPMNREIRVSNSREQIDALWDGLKEKFFVGGWKTPE